MITPDVNDAEIHEDRTSRISLLRTGAERLERRACKLILEADALRKLADRIETTTAEAK